MSWIHNLRQGWSYRPAPPTPPQPTTLPRDDRRAHPHFDDEPPACGTDDTSGYLLYYCAADDTIVLDGATTYTCLLFLDKRSRFRTRFARTTPRELSPSTPMVATTASATICPSIRAAGCQSSITSRSTANTSSASRHLQTAIPAKPRGRRGDLRPAPGSPDRKGRP